ncbi:MAG: hypothetical protein ACRD11_04405 [Terriglobia bacterium]
MRILRVLAALAALLATTAAASASNVFNHPNFGLPESDISSPGTYGTVASTTYDLYGQQSRFVDFMLRLQF